MGLYISDFFATLRTVVICVWHRMDISNVLIHRIGKEGPVTALRTDEVPLLATTPCHVFLGTLTTLEHLIALLTAEFYCSLANLTQPRFVPNYNYVLLWNVLIALQAVEFDGVLRF